MNVHILQMRVSTWGESHWELCVPCGSAEIGKRIAPKFQSGVSGDILWRTGRPLIGYQDYPFGTLIGKDFFGEDHTLYFRILPMEVEE